jgi:hypothetical protein
MKKFFVISVVLCFTMLLFAAFVYAAWPPTNETIGYGYAQLNGSSSYVFRNGNDIALYTDAHLASDGGDKLELAFNSSNVLDGVLLYLGKPDQKSSQYEEDDPTYPPGYCSPRSVNLWFDIKDGKTTLNYKKYKAAFDILVWKDSTKTIRRGNPEGRKYYLNDNSVRLDVRRWIDTNIIEHSLIFSVEPSTTPCDSIGPNAITETAINNFYTNDTNYNYEDYLGIGTSAFDVVVYFISFNNDFTFNKVTGSNNTWTISGSGSATLGVVTVVNENPHQTSWIPLASYTNLPFQVTVSTTNPFTAPPRFDKPTTLWGEIKSQ